MAEGNKIPEIRFKGFEGEWNARGFSELFANIPNNTLSRSELNYNFGLAKNIHYGDVLIKFGELLDIEKGNIPFVTNKDLANKLKTSKLQDGDIIIADAAEDETVGKCTEVVNMGENIVLSGLHTIAVRPILPFASKYLGYYINSSAYHDQLLPLMQGTKVLSISKSAIRDTSIVFPNSLAEQTKIGNYFQQLDTLITLHQKKYDKLLNVKKAMIEKMFPKKGADVPEIRFKGFSEKWEEKKFSAIVTRISFMSKKIGLPRIEYEDIIPSKGELNKNIFQKESSKIGIEFNSGDVLFGKLRPYLKNWLLPNFNGIAIGDFWVLRGNEINSKFIYYLIQTLGYETVANQSSGTKMPRSDWNLVSKTLFSTPIKNIEQTKIGGLFKSLDTLITLNQTELEKLKNIKKACLEKMFV